MRCNWSTVTPLKKQDFAKQCFCSLGIFWREHVFGGAEPEAWKYLSVAIPAACISGPLGALLVSHCHRLVHATTCYTLDTIALVS